MAVFVILTVGINSWKVEAHLAAWKAAQVFTISTTSILEAISLFNAGDFDLVLIGDSVPVEALEKLTFQIRATGSHVPIACIAGESGYHDSLRMRRSSLIPAIY